MNRFNEMKKKFGDPNNSLEALEYKMNPSQGIYEGGMPSQDYRDQIKQDLAMQSFFDKYKEKGNVTFDPKQNMDENVVLTPSSEKSQPMMPEMNVPQAPSQPEEKSSGFDPKALLSMLPKPGQESEKKEEAPAAPVSPTYTQLSNERSGDARQNLLDSYKAVKARGGSYGI